MSVGGSATMSNAGERKKGLLDVSDTFAAGATVAIVLNVIQIAILLVAPVISIYISFQGITQWLYLMPLTIENAIEGRMNAAKGIFAIGIVFTLITVVLLLTGVSIPEEW